MEKIVLLGTGSAFPTKSRNHPSVYLNLSGKRVLLDCGEGTQRQIRSAGLSPSIDYILLTHWHGDHSLGVGGIIQSLNMLGSSKPLYIFGPKGTDRSVKDIMDTYKFYSRIDVVPKVINQSRERKVLSICDYDIYAINVKHSVPCVGYKVKERDTLNIDKDFLKANGIKSSPELKELKKGRDIVYNGKKIKASEATYLKRGKTLVYLTDLMYEDKLARFANGADVLITECTLSSKEKEKAKRYFHFTSEDAVRLALKAKVKKLVLIHQSQRYEDTDTLVEEVNGLCAKYRCKFSVTFGKDLEEIRIGE
ncbi:MAG: ribonuclease Z [Candidatus Parvarchaeota archaeon]|nr:ribonuclease Z [Candidatus Parvarchaeota archaeon]